MSAPDLNGHPVDLLEHFLRAAGLAPDPDALRQFRTYCDELVGLEVRAAAGVPPGSILIVDRSGRVVGVADS